MIYLLVFSIVFKPRRPSSLSSLFVRARGSFVFSSLRALVTFSREIQLGVRNFIAMTFFVVFSSCSFCCPAAAAAKGRYIAEEREINIVSCLFQRVSSSLYFILLSR